MKQSFHPGPIEPNPDFKIVINLGEIIGAFDYDLGDDRFATIASQFTGDTSGYLCRGMIHCLLGIPGGLSISEAARFFPIHLQPSATIFLEHFWKSLAADIARMEGMIRHQNPGRSFDANQVPTPMVNGYHTLTIWYHWTLATQQLEEPLDYDGTDEPEGRGF